MITSNLGVRTLAGSTQSFRWPSSSFLTVFYINCQANLYSDRLNVTATTTYNSSMIEQIRTKTKKTGGSSRNGRSSRGRRLGIKRYNSELVQTSAIIMRQRGAVIGVGENVVMGKDHTISALIPGTVCFTRKIVSTPRTRPKSKAFANVIPHKRIMNLVNADDYEGAHVQAVDKVL